MTNETPHQMAVTVEQCDIDAAKAYWNRRMAGWQEQTQAQDALVQAFVRHRLTQQSAATGGEVPAGWIDWKGGECPVDGDVWVEVQFGARDTQTGKARWFDGGVSYKPSAWKQNGPHEGWIIRYCITAAPSPTLPNDMARENERLRNALTTLRDLPIVENDGPNVLHLLDGKSYEGPVVDWTFKIIRKVKEIAGQALSTTPSNPPAPSEGGKS